MINWKLIETKILDVVRRAMMKYSEKWVTAEKVCEHVNTLTPRFLQDHGEMFNRTRVEWRDKQGVLHTQSWLYPLHEILEMVKDGRIKELQET